MSSPHAALTTMFPPLTRPKNPGLAAVIGFLTGGIGLAIYFRSLRDLFPVELVAMIVIVGSAIAGVEPVEAWRWAGIPAAIVGASYCFWRAQSSNRRLAASIVPSVAVGSAG
jgi:hypothetical protein